ncbi:MAG: hypothetical protein MMC23_009512 [Stictis urceolatum]|nr:hypothetical protein [Stictis urceolata]
MPIKLPKGFQRRKSSGNALDENPNPPQPSFRVFERTPDGSKSFDGGGTLRRMMDSRPMSDGQYRDYEIGRPGLNRGSGGTQNSASTGGLYDTSSSARFGSSSTLPSSSSFDAGHDETPHAHPKPPQKAAAPSGFSLRAAGRTFSFGARKSIQHSMPSPNEIPLPQQHAEYSDIPDIYHNNRQRAMTDTSYASGSTTTPPKLLDTDFGNGGDGLGDIFADLGREKRKSRGDLEAGVGNNVQSAERSNQGPPAPIRLDRSNDIVPAPRSDASHHSQDGLISSSPQQDDDLFDHERITDRSHYAAPYSKPTSHDAHSQNAYKPQVGQRVPLHSTGSEPEPSSALLDEDVRLAMRYVGNPAVESDPKKKGPSQRVPRRGIPEPSHPRAVTLYDGENQDHQGSERSRNDSISTTPKAKQAILNQVEEGLIDDLDFQELAMSADRFQSRSTSPPPRRPPPSKTQGKVMTPAQFEMYRKEQESLRNQYASKSGSEDEDSDADGYGDDDEEERNKEMARQRRRQDAQMSVYRQQMMKVTGEQPPLTAGIPRAGPSTAAFSIAQGASHENRLDAKSSGDEDEDIPLGILAAHGFPSKERPPSHLNRMGSQPNIRYTSETYPPPPASVSGASAKDGGGNSMPAFARNLPKDPFYGASLVNPTDRQSLAFGTGSQSVYGGSQGPAPNPGGLVGVIAKEERARAMRRGSPNAAALEMPGGMPQMLNLSGGSPGLNPDQQAHMQMSHQMTQMMQMQMQWMQQMMAMQGMQGQQMPPMPNLPANFGMSTMSNFGNPQSSTTPVRSYMHLSPNVDQTGPRPTSTGNMATSGPQRPQFGPRSMSMLSPDFQGWNSRNSRASVARSHLGSASGTGAQGQVPGFGLNGSGLQHNAGYAHSLAPSERSNVGLAPRYRPVSTAPVDSAGRTSTMGSSALRAWEGPGKGKAAVTLRVVPVKNNEDDDDEEEGWEEMRKKREKKRSLWRGKKADRDESSTLEGVFYPSMD